MEVVKKPLTLIIGGLTVEEAKQLTKAVLEWAEKDPTRYYPCWVKGLEHVSMEEVKKIFEEIFPSRGAGG